MKTKATGEINYLFCMAYFELKKKKKKMHALDLKFYLSFNG